MTFVTPTILKVVKAILKDAKSFGLLHGESRPGLDKLESFFYRKAFEFSQEFQPGAYKTAEETLIHKQHNEFAVAYLGMMRDMRAKALGHIPELRELLPEDEQYTEDFAPVSAAADIAAAIGVTQANLDRFTALISALWTLSSIAGREEISEEVLRVCKALGSKAHMVESNLVKMELLNATPETLPALKQKYLGRFATETYSIIELVTPGYVIPSSWGGSVESTLRDSFKKAATS